MTEQEWLTTEDPMAIYRLIEAYRNDEQIVTYVGDQEKHSLEVSNRQILLWLAACIDLSKYDYSGTYYKEMYRQPWRTGDSSPRGVINYLQDVRLWCSKEEDKPGDPSLQLRTHLLRDVIGNPWRRVATLDPQWLTPQVLSLAQAAWDDRPDNRPILDTFRLLMLADALEEAGMLSNEEYPCPVCAGYADDPENPWKRIGYRPERDPASGRHEGGWTNCKTCNSGGRSCVRAGIAKRPNPILEHLRSPTPHIRGCWALDLILGKG